MITTGNAFIFSRAGALFVFAILLQCRQNLGIDRAHLRCTILVPAIHACTDKTRIRCHDDSGHAILVDSLCVLLLQHQSHAFPLSGIAHGFVGRRGFVTDQQDIIDIDSAYGDFFVVDFDVAASRPATMRHQYPLPN